MDGKKNRMQVLTLVLCVALLGLNLWQLRQISDLRGQLGSVETNLQMETRRLDERVQAEQRTVTEADKLVQDWELHAVDVDPASRCLRAEVSLRLKEWREDTQVRLTAVQGTNTRQAAMTGEAGQYSGTVEIPVNSQGVRLLAGVSAGGLRNADKTGTLTVSLCEAELEGFEGTGLPQLFGQVFRLRRNGDVAAEKTAMYGETIGQYTCEELSASASIGDEFILTFFCRDESGLGYEFFLNGWSIDDNGLGERLAPEADWPKVTWD